MAVMLGAALGTTAEFWHGLQADYDLTSFRQSAEGHTAESVETLLATQQ
jgi:plasmid maintenance system antidote protein VapI